MSESDLLLIRHIVTCGGTPTPSLRVSGHRLSLQAGRRQTQVSGHQRPGPGSRPPDGTQRVSRAAESARTPESESAAQTAVGREPGSIKRHSFRAWPRAGSP